MHAIAKGRVQGVFFRATTRDHALSLGLTGTVKNLPDGTVEIWAKGSQEELFLLLEKLKQEKGEIRIDEIIVEYPPIKKTFQDFSVIY